LIEDKLSPLAGGKRKRKNRVKEREKRLEEMTLAIVAVGKNIRNAVEVKIILIAKWVNFY